MGRNYRDLFPDIASAFRRPSWSTVVELRVSMSPQLRLNSPFPAMVAQSLVFEVFRALRFQ
jgi:hypothetical protein